MPTSYASLPSSPIAAARGAIAVFSILPVVVGLRGILYPQDAAGAFGVDSASCHATGRYSNPFIIATSGRTLTGGLTLFACNYLKYDRAVGVFLALGWITGLVDAIAVLGASGQSDGTKEGNEQAKVARQAAWGHIGIPAFSSALGFWMLLRSESQK